LRVSKLPRILPGIHAPLPSGQDDPEVLGIAHDSRRVKPGWVFVAINGHQRNGARFAEDAAARGAVAIVTESRARLSPPTPQFVVKDARRALAALAATFYSRPSRHVQVIGVTGTNGKTTTTYMVRSVLESAGFRCGLLGTIAYETGRRVLPASITTPESVDVQEFLAEMRQEGMDYAALEVSSHALCMRRVDLVQFAAAVFTNLTPEHLDYHGTFARYRRAKAKLFHALGPAAKAVLNADDPSSKAMARATCAGALTYGLRKGADVTARVRESSLDGIRMSLSHEGRNVDLRLPVIGRHNVYNALAAAGTALALGHDLEAVKNGLETMPMVPGRLETSPWGAGCRGLVDYAHTDQALDAVRESLRRLTKRRILVVFGAGGDRDHAKRPRMGRVVEKGADLAWVTSDNPRSEEPMDIINDILGGMRHRKHVRVEPDRRAAIGQAIGEALPGDLVLIAGKGHERTQRFKDTVVPFDDREAARQAFAPAEGSSMGA